MARIGLTPDELLLEAWSRPPASYAARTPGLDVLEGETLALVGSGSDLLLERLGEVLAPCTIVDGGVAAAGGVLRVHAQQAARVGVRALAISEPFGPALSPAARALAVADLAGLGSLGLTTVVAIADSALAALVADRVVVVADGEPVVAYPVIAPAPRRLSDVAPVLDRLRRRTPPAAAPVGA